MMIGSKLTRIDPNKIRGIKMKGANDNKVNIIVNRKNVIAGKMPNMANGKEPITITDRKSDIILGKKLNILTDEKLNMTSRQA